MNAYKKYKNRLERYLQSEQGKRFINFAYSIGAAIVILGAMFSILHLPFGYEMLFIGMVTECIVFILSAFDTPIRDYRWEQVFPELSEMDPEKNPSLRNAIAQHIPHATSPRGTSCTDAHIMPPEHDQAPKNPYAHPSTSPNEAHYLFDHNLSAYSEEYGKQMDSLNRTLSGLNSIYEIQLKSVSSQIGTIEQINQGLTHLKTVYGDTLPDGTAIKEQTEKMATQLKELNEVYARMLNAMTVKKQDKSDNLNA